VALRHLLHAPWHVAHITLRQWHSVPHAACAYSPIAASVKGAPAVIHGLPSFLEQAIQGLYMVGVAVHCPIWLR